MKLLKTKCTDMTIGQTLIITIALSVVSLGLTWLSLTIPEKIFDRKSRKEESK